MPVRLVVPLPQIQGRITSMPGYLNEDKALGMKVVTYFQDNPKQNLPAILATIMLFSAETGKMIAAMDGGLHHRDPNRLRLGAGDQSIGQSRHAGAGNSRRRRASARPYSSAHPRAPAAAASSSTVHPAKARCRSSKNWKSRAACPSKSSNSPQDAVRDSDLLVTVTTAKEPIVKPEWLKPGVHINAVGSHRPDLREIDGATLKRAKVVVDSREAIMAECGDILLALKEKSISEADIHGEIGEVLAGSKTGTKQPQRDHALQIRRHRHSRCRHGATGLSQSARTERRHECGNLTSVALEFRVSVSGFESTRHPKLREGCDDLGSDELFSSNLTARICFNSKKPSAPMSLRCKQTRANLPALNSESVAAWEEHPATQRRSVTPHVASRFLHRLPGVLRRAQREFIRKKRPS